MSQKQSLGQSIARIGGLIHSTLNFDEMMERVIAEAAQAVGSERAALSLRQGDQWVVRYIHGLSKEVIGARMDDEQEPHTVLAIETKKPVVINDTFTDERVNREHMQQWGVRSVLVVPLVTADQALGVLSFSRHKAGAPFQKSHVDFAHQLASSLSLAVRNARLFQNLRAELAERRKAEQALQEANEKLQGQTEGLQTQGEELQTQTEELRVQTEELQAQAEELRTANRELRESEQRYRSSFENMLDGYAYCEMLFDDHSRPADFRYLRVNDAFGKLTGRQNVVGRKASEVFPGIAEQHPELLEIYGRVATTGRPERFVLECKPLGLWFSISVYSSRQGYFTAVFDNITERKGAERRVVEESREVALANRILRVFLEETGDDLFDQALQIVLEGMESRHGVFGYIDENGDLVCPSMSKLLAECEVANKCIRYPQDRWKGLWNQALRGKKTLFTNEPPPVPPGHVPIRNNLAAPIVFQGRVIGLLNLANKEAGYTPADTARIKAITARIAPVLYAWTQRELREKERRQAEAVLRESEKSFRTIFEGNTDGLLIVEAASRRFLMGNRAICRMLGYQPEEIANLRVEDIHRPEDLPLVLGHFERLASGKEGTGESIPVRRKDGSVFFADITANPIILSEQTCLVGSFRDITERQRAEEALRRAHEELKAQSGELTVANQELRVQSIQLQQSEQRLRMALEGGQMGRWEWDLATDSMFWGERTYELLGLEPFMEASVETLLDCIHPEDRGAVKKLIARVMNEAKDFQAEFRVLHHRQAPRSDIAWLALHAQVIRDEQERAVRTIGVVYDITPRKQMEAELRRLNEQLEEEVRAQTEELRDSIDRLQDEVVRRVLAEGKLRKNSRLLEAFFQHTIAPLAFLDKSFSFVRVNEAFAAAAGKPAPYFVHKGHFALYPSEEDRVIFEQVVQSRQPYRAFARPFPYFDKPQQPTRYWNWRLTPLLDDKGQAQFLVFNLEDVTEQQKTFGELEHRAGLLQKLTLELSQAEDRERRRLAEILHDDLQQVLAAAKFHLGLLTSRIKGDEQTKELVGQLTRMLKESIEKSRSLSHELSPAVLYQGDLGETFEWLARQVQTKHGLTVHTEVHGKIDTSSEPIKAFLFRAAQEILFNAVKHAHVDEARLRLQRRHGRLWLTIADRGRGFDPQTLGRTTGFGLFSIRERVELLGGRMKIHSAKNKGSVVVIAVADAADEEGRKVRTEEGRRVLSPSDLPTFLPSELPSSRSPTGGPLRILLVDDHNTIRAGLAALIGEQADMEVVGQAGDGRKAVELAHDLLPDVVIMDVAMPTMPGDEATRQIKATLPQARIIALSMFEEPGVAQRMRDAGAEIYLPKTGPSEGLLAAIRGRG